jgi:hypothetical protein
MKSSCKICSVRNAIFTFLNQLTEVQKMNYVNIRGEFTFKKEEIEHSLLRVLDIDDLLLDNSDSTLNWNYSISSDELTIYCVYFDTQALTLD